MAQLNQPYQECLLMKNIDRIMSETSDKSDRFNLKKLNNMNDIELDNVSFSSSNGEKRGRKKKKVNYAEISAASSKKGKKIKGSFKLIKLN